MDTRADARALFAEFLERLEEEDGLDFEEWVKAHAELADELRRLHSDWTEGASEGLSFFGAARALPSLGAKLEPGKVVGDFRLVELVGRGGMGQVWEAHQTSLGNRRVAIKFVNPERVTRRQLEYFEREARAGGRLAHPGLVSVFGTGTDDGITWIAMEFVPGSWTLRDFLEARARDEKLPAGYDPGVARFIEQVARAMEAAHEAGVIHRDLKPQNILITRDERPKVTDFGLARIVDESALSQTGDVAGTYYYMSPEQIAARRADLDHRTDVFSLGVVLYEMLALQRPFQGDTAQQVASKIQLDDPLPLREIRSRVPYDLATICGKALEKEPARRYPSMGSFADDLARHLANEPIRAHPPSRISRVRKWTRRNPTKTVASIVAGAAFVVISALALRIAGQNSELEATTNEARASALAEKARAEEVLQLSHAQNYEDLMTEAADLWPAHPGHLSRLEEWQESADELLGQLPLLRAKRDQLRAQALPPTVEERAADRSAHPEFGDLLAARRDLASRRRALEQRTGGGPGPEADVDWSKFPSEATGLIAAAQMRVVGNERLRGQEDIGYALAQRAVEVAADDERMAALAVLAQASSAVGLDEDAVALAYLVAEERPGAESQALLELVEREAEKWASEERLQDEELELQQLEGSCRELEERTAERLTWTFAGDAETAGRARWWHGQLVQLIRDLESLEDPVTGLASPDGTSTEHGWSVPRRIAFARDLGARMAPGGEFSARWEAALPGIRDAYPGLDIGPEEGLVPLEQDPRTGLWTFWHVQSGSEPRTTGDGAPGPEDGLALVLLPGGAFWAGTQWQDPNGRNYDPLSRQTGNEKRVRRVEVAPFFASKYEMTQEQWTRLTGSNPSFWTRSTDVEWIPGVHPVESVDLFSALLTLERSDLQVPTQAQWEYACRAGSGTPQPFPMEDFARHANIADEAYAARFTSTIRVEAWDDGAGTHAPVGSFEPNGFGLHDTIGNVNEWCLNDDERPSDGVSSPALPIEPLQDTSLRAVRGGSFGDPVLGARATIAQIFAPTFRSQMIGVRPVRPVAPPSGAGR